MHLGRLTQFTLYLLTYLVGTSLLLVSKAIINVNMYFRRLNMPALTYCPTDRSLQLHRNEVYEYLVKPFEVAILAMGKLVESIMKESLGNEGSRI